ncbi:MAG: TauD/TfdA family dioxygenase [Sphingomonadales bacterium]|nr:TauD/TfdA family dioxygenase [Sphingomonadales bacterium]
MSGIRIRDLRADLSFGSLVEGLSLAGLEDGDTRSRLEALLVARGLIVFRGVEPSSRMQVAISEVFGPLKDHPTTTTTRTAEDVAPGVIDMHYRPDPDDIGAGEGLVEIDGRKVARFSPWHFDHCYQDELNRAGVLRAPINAPVGGRTGFADGIDLYHAFPRALRDRLEGLNIIYTLDTRLSKMRFGVNFVPLTEYASTDQLLREAAIFPRALHPAVWTRPQSEKGAGEKVLHFAPWMAEGIEGHEDAEGDALFEEACQTLNRIATGAHAYFHEWEPTDMVIWDNLRMLHAVEGCDAKYERRTLRTTIRGDYGLGRFEGGKKIGEVQREIAM